MRGRPTIGARGPPPKGTTAPAVVVLDLSLYTIYATLSRGTGFSAASLTGLCRRVGREVAGGRGRDSLDTLG